MSSRRRKRKDLTKYEHVYPSDLPWRSRLWTLQEGDQLQDQDGRLYLLVQVNGSPIPGVTPTFTLEPLPNPSNSPSSPLSS